MAICKRRCGRCALLCIGSALTVFGVIAVGFWTVLFDKILESQMVLTNTSIIYKFWKEPPVEMYTSIYMFNWTNAEEVLRKRWAVKPTFEECGPYVFSTRIVHLNVTPNENGTITFNEKFIWHFSPSHSKGRLDDKITNLNPVAVVLANAVKKKNFVIRKGMGWILKHFERSLIITKTANELLFAGYNDRLIKLLPKFPNIDIPLDGRFGWLHFVNDSATMVGTSTIYTGEGNIDLLGKMNLWNRKLYINKYNGHCALVNGTSEELFPPVNSYKKLAVFTNVLCSSITLHQRGEKSENGINGKKFVGTDYTFDNGSKYPEQACFQGNRKIPSGARDISGCFIGAPTFISFPHFYLADSSYREKVNGMNPNGTKHESVLILEPNTGIPLHGRIQLQLNLFIEEISSIKMFSGIKPTFMPIFWINEEIILPGKYSIMVKVLLTIRSVGPYLGWISLCTGIPLVSVMLYIFFRSRPKDEDTEELLEEETE